MKPLILTIAFLGTLLIGRSQTSTIPGWVGETFKAKGLDKKYTINTSFKPYFLQADYNGDKFKDVAVFITNKANQKKGILLLHCKTNEFFVFGAGRDFGNGSDNFSWLKKWTNYSKAMAQETEFDKESGDILGSKDVKLTRPGILIEDYEDGAAIAGGIIYWNGRKYIWIHQGE